MKGIEFEGNGGEPQKLLGGSVGRDVKVFCGEFVCCYKTHHLPRHVTRVEFKPVRLVLSQ